MSASTSTPADPILERLTALHPKAIDLSLARVERLLGALGHPECRLPPAIHVAGTNGKGSTVAFLRAIAEAAGLRVHAYTSPHLVRFNERVRVAGTLIADDALAALLEEVERANAGQPITFFEITTAAAFLAFARAPADLTLLEVGLGGRLDATNVVARPAACAIAPVSIDHTDFLGATLDAIAGEKAGILKPGVACAVAAQPDEALDVIVARAETVGAPLSLAGRDWHTRRQGEGFVFVGARTLALPRPALAGAHQIDNAALAVATIELLGDPRCGAASLAAGVARAEWPARLQRLTRGPLAAALPAGWELWLDGGHNESGATAIAAWARGLADGRPLHLAVALRTTKRAEPIFAALAPAARRVVCIGNPSDPVAAAPEALAQAARVARCADVAAAPDVAAGVALLAARGGAPARVLICGSLYLAGSVLAEHS